MSYSDINLSKQEKETKKIRLVLQQSAFNSDLRKNKREQENLLSENRVIKLKISRLQADKSINDKELDKIKSDRVFIEDKLRHLKKEIIDIQHFLNNEIR